MQVSYVTRRAPHSNPEIETILKNHSNAALDAYRQLGTECDIGALNLHLGMLLDSSFQVLDRWETAVPDIERRELKAISRRAAILLRDIRRLRETPLIWAQVATGRIRSDDVLFRFCPLDQRFHTLLNLEDLAKQIGPKVRPDFSRTLEDLLAYVTSRCGNPNYAKLEVIFDALGIPIRNLKQWHYDRKRASARQ